MAADNVCRMATPEPETEPEAEFRALGREEILAVEDNANQVVAVEVPEWGGASSGVLIRVLSGRERDAYEAAQSQNSGALKPNFRARFAALVLAAPDGSPLFNWRDHSAVEKLGRKSALALNRIFDAGMRVNGWGEEAIEGLEKNSEGGQSADSGIG